MLESIPPNPRGVRLVGRGMSGPVGPLLGPVAHALFDDIPYPDDAAARIRELSQHGVVVYVHRSRNAVDYLALSRACRRLRLPEARYVGGLGVALWQPWWRLLGRQRGLRGAPEERVRRDEWLLQETVRSGYAAELFLRRPLTLVTTRAEYRARFIEALIRLQREFERPIFLVPHLLALRQRTSHLEPTAADVVFGTGEEPGALRAFARLALSRKHARWEVSEPIDLLRFVRERADQSDAVLAKKVRWTLLNHLARSERAVHGPATKSHARMAEDTLKDPALREEIAAIADRDHEVAADLERRARKLYDEIAARFDIDVVRALDPLLRLVWHRIYDGIEIDRAGIERIRRAAREGPLVIVPSHRSHVDYLVMNQALFWNGLMPPLIAAGANLSFFPLGPILRRGGAYFLRRTFKGDRLYAAVFRAYVKRLFKEGYTQEFFIEGGRSRTGKTLPPKMGILTMLVDAFLESRQPDAMFVPTNISYERIIEADSYTRELHGAEKRQENAGALLRSASVLRSKYGRVFVRIDEPISLAGFMRERGFDPASHTKEEKRHFISTLAYRICFGINRAQVVTATALVVTALFGLRRRGLPRPMIEDAVKGMVDHMSEVSGGMIALPTRLGSDLEGTVVGALDWLCESGLVHKEAAAGESFYRVDEKAWLELDFHKNGILHHFASEAILATAARALELRAGATLEIDALAESTQRLSQLFKLEFIFPVGETFEERFEATLQRAVRRGVLVVDETGVSLATSPRAPQWFSFCANLIASFVEAYAAVFEHLEQGRVAENRKQLTGDLLEQLRADYLADKLQCDEAVNKALIENALSWMQDRGLLQWSPEGLSLPGEGAFERAQLTLLLQRARLPRRAAP